MRRSAHRDIKALSIALVTVRCSLLLVGNGDVEASITVLVSCSLGSDSRCVCAQHDAPATPCDAAIIRGLVSAADDSRTVMRRVLELRPAEATAAAAAVSPSSSIKHMCIWCPRQSKRPPEV